MEDDQKLKHICKFCSKIFPCGRSLGGHMRSHLITISSSSSSHHKTNLKKKLPPLITDENINPKKSSKDALLQEKLCKECGRSFSSWKALFGHMKCHRAMEEKEEEDSLGKMIVDSQSDNETASVLCRKKRSGRISKRYTNSSSSNLQNFSSSCVSEIDQQEQEEVAFSLILLSMDTGNSGVESSNNSSEFIVEDKNNENFDVKSSKSKNSSGGEFMKFKKLRNGKLEPIVLHSDQLFLKDKLKQGSNPDNIPRRKNGFKLEVSSDVEVENKKNLDEIEVNSPKYLIKKALFGPDCDFENKKSKNKRSYSELESKLPMTSDQSQTFQDSEKRNKFTCAICKKAFVSYQALGGHRASHKKFNGSCAPRTENSPIENPMLIKSEKMISVFKAKVDSDSDIGLKKNKEHECPICFRVFSSGQALGGHKRSHLIADQAKSVSITTNIPSIEVHKPIPEIHNFLDLNLPPPVDEECHEYQPWWIGTSHEPLLDLLSN